MWLIQAKKRSITQRWYGRQSQSGRLACGRFRPGWRWPLRRAPLVACIRKGELHERPAPARGAQQGPDVVPVLGRCRVGLEFERAVVRVHHRVLVAAFNLAASVVALHTAAFGGLDTLAFDHGRCRAGLAPARSRSRMTRWWLTTSHVPLSRSQANQRYTLLQGGKPLGIMRQVMPPRST